MPPETGAWDVAEDVEAAGAEVTLGCDAGETEGLLPEFWIASRCATKVVEAAGQPMPGPFKLCSVTMAVSMRVSCEVLELSIGKETATEGLFTTRPAATLVSRD
jgi:hypothetical protein